MSETNPSIEESAWYIVYTKPRAEKKLSELLKKYHLENYLPIRKERKNGQIDLSGSMSLSYLLIFLLKLSSGEIKIKSSNYPVPTILSFIKANPQRCPKTIWIF